MILFCCSSFGFSSADRAIIAVKSDKTIYKIGQKIRVTVNIGQNGFIYLFNIRPDGMVDLLIPNRFPMEIRARGRVRLEIFPNLILVVTLSRQTRQEKPL